MNATKIKQIMKLRGDVNAFASTIQARQKTQALFLLCMGFYGCDGDQFEEVSFHNSTSVSKVTGRNHQRPG